jgi:hypothetical protein
MKLKVGIPYAKHSRMTDETLGSLEKLRQCKDLDITVITQQGSNIPRARNAMINGEKSNLIHQELDDFDYFLGIDADIGFTVNNIKQLLAHDMDIISGACVHKHIPDRIAAGWFKEIEGISRIRDRVPLGTKGLLEVDWAGAAFLLVKREVFERVPYPWFTCMEVKYQTEEGQCAQVVSEDIGFCMKMRQHGEKIMLDADCRVDHVVHPNEIDPNATLTDALNNLLKNRDIIIKNIKNMSVENQKLRQMLAPNAAKDNT